MRRVLLFGAIAAVAIAASLLLPDHRTQMALLWVMVIFALTWDVVGGRWATTRSATSSSGSACTPARWSSAMPASTTTRGLAAGVALGTLLAVVAAAVIGAGLLGLRGHYFAIGTLGLGIAAAEIAASWDFIGAGAGLVTPCLPGDIEDRTLFYYWLSLIVAVITFSRLRWLYAGRFGLAINAIRDDEDKARERWASAPRATRPSPGASPRSSSA